MLKVYNVPLGASMREDFCIELASKPYGEGVMVLPTGLLQNKAAQTYNVPTTGFDTLASKVLNMNGYLGLHEVNRREQELIVEQALQYWADRGEITYFAQMMEKQGFVNQLTTFLGQLARSGATVEELQSAFEAWERTSFKKAKDEEIWKIYYAYRFLLKNDNNFDLEGKYRLALKILKEEEEPKLPWRYIYVSDFATLDALQLDFLVALAKHCQIKVGIAYNEKQDVFVASEGTLEQLQRVAKLEFASGVAPKRKAGLDYLLQNIGREFAGKQELQEEEVLLRAYSSQKAEIASVLTEIKEAVLAGAKLTDFSVAVRDLSTYTGLKACADEYGIPISLPKTEQLSVQPLAELVQQLLQAVADNRNGAEAYFCIFNNGIVKLLNSADESIPVENIERLRQNTYFQHRSQVQGAIKELLQESVLLDAINSFIANCKAKASMEAYTQYIEAFMSSLQLKRQLGLLYKHSKVSLAGLQAILESEQKFGECLRGLREDYANSGLDKELYSLSDFDEALQDASAEKAISLTNGRFDGLLVTNIVQLQGAHWPKVYLLGLREGEFPKNNRENWLYNDKERGELKSLGINLPNTFEQYQEERCLFAGALAAATEQLVLSYYVDATAEASPFIDDVKAIFTNLVVEEEQTKLKASLLEALAQAPSCEEHWLEETLGEASLAAAKIDLENRPLHQGLLLNEELIARLQVKTGYSFSASTLENYASCPFKYLGLRLWGQEAFQEQGELPDAGVKGSLIHDTLAKFVHRYLGNKPQTFEYQTLKEFLWTDFEAVVQEYIERGKLLDNEFWPSEAMQIKRKLGWWLEHEIYEQQHWGLFKPTDLERSFGYTHNPIELQTSSELPVFLTGRIDRIDASDNNIFITDYKSGDGPVNGSFAANDDLQMAFYMLAAEKLYSKKTVLGGGYLSLKTRSRKGGIAWSATGNSEIPVPKDNPFESWDEVRAAAENMILQQVEPLYAGNFTLAPKKGACDYCELRDICRQRVLAENVEDVEQHE